MCPSVFHNFVRKKNESTGSHVIKNRAHLTCPGALDLTWPVFIPELEMVKTIPKWWTNGIGWIPYRPLEATRARQEDDIGTCGPWAKWILDSQKDGQNGGWIDGLMVA